MNLLAEAMTNFLDTVGGLPTHPLVVHLAVVMLPLGAISLMTIILVPRWRTAYGWLTMAVLTVGVAGAVLAAQTGEALARSVGLPADHARWGDLLEKLALLLLVSAAAWFMVQRRTARLSAGTATALQRTALQTTLAVFSLATAAALLVLTVVVGHSGASAVWEGRLATVPGASGPPAPAPPAGSASPSYPAASVVSMAEVVQHATATNCWSVVDGSVYNLSAWIPRHPGGPTVIEALCGKDGSAAFHNEHDAQREPRDALAEFMIGTLGR